LLCGPWAVLGGCAFRRLAFVSGPPPRDSIFFFFFFQALFLHGPRSNFLGVSPGRPLGPGPFLVFPLARTHFSTRIFCSRPTFSFMHVLGSFFLCPFLISHRLFPLSSLERSCSGFFFFVLAPPWYFFFIRSSLFNFSFFSPFVFFRPHPPTPPPHPPHTPHTTNPPPPNNTSLPVPPVPCPAGRTLLAQSPW